jgi:7-cyano-7-deazaguanine synthase
MDSSTLLLRALKDYDTCTAISFDYGQKHRVELERAQQLISYLQQNGRNVNYRVIKLDGLVDLLNSNLVEGGADVPEGHYKQENMKETVVPNRNAMFSTIAQAVALSIATKKQETCDIALGIHKGDEAVYPDCRAEFRDAIDHAFRVGNWDAERVGYFTPYLEVMKFDILQDGETLCKELELDFDEVYRRTNTSYKPYPSGNSDYKSASSVERIEAFIKLGRKDPVVYEDETGVVSWEVAKSAVEKVLANHSA